MDKLQGRLTGLQSRIWPEIRLPQSENVTSLLGLVTKSENAPTPFEHKLHCEQVLDTCRSFLGDDVFGVGTAWDFEVLDQRALMEKLEPLQTVARSLPGKRRHKMDFTDRD